MTTTPAAIRPRALRPGGRIGIVTTAAPQPAENPDRFDHALERLRSAGYETTVAATATSQRGYMAGGEGELADDLHAMFEDRAIDAIMCSGGGVNGNRLLRRLDLDLIASHPKILVGVSDPTTILNAVSASTGLITFHGPSIIWDLGAPDMPEWTFAHFLQVAGGEPGGALLSASPLTWYRPGAASGRIVGGCLSSLRALLGTPWEPDWSGAILFWEDVGKPLDELDGVLTHFRDRGVFDRIAGMVIGELVDCAPAGGRMLNDLVGDLFAEYDFPIAAGLAFGHTPLKHTLTIGGEVTIDASTDTLRLSPPWVER